MQIQVYGMNYQRDGKKCVFLSILKLEQTASAFRDILFIALKVLNFLLFQAAISDFENKYIVQPGEIGVEDRYLLELDICSVSFSHHPLFSREHVLAQRVTELYQKYNHSVVMGQQQRLAGRLEALRRARDSLKKAVRQMADGSPQQLERLQRSL
jgi:coiled-coil and C2 domain-containing protein 2A